MNEPSAYILFFMPVGIVLPIKTYKKEEIWLKLTNVLSTFYVSSHLTPISHKDRHHYSHFVDGERE